MRKSGIIFLLLAMLVLSACSAQPTPTQLASPTSSLPVGTPPTATVTITPLPTIALSPTPTIEPTVAIPLSAPATCQVVAVVPTADPTAQAILPAVAATDWVSGSEAAGITIIEYGDFQSTASAQLSSLLQQILKKYPNDVRLVFRHFPLNEQYDKDVLAAQAAEAAGLQGKFWQYANFLYKNQSAWVSLTADAFTQWAYERAAELGLDGNQFKTDMIGTMIVEKIKATRSDAVKLMQAGALTTDPYLFFNDAAITPPYSLDTLSSVVEYLNLPARAFTACPPMNVDATKKYTATIHTEKGDIVIDLFADKAPWAVNSFIYLAQQGWFKGSGFYRVIPGFMAQAGDPSNSGMGNPGYAFTDELNPALHFDKPGVLGMANAGPNQNGSQFFITYAAAPSLDGKYTIFGQVTAGMEVLKTLRPRNPATDAILLTPDPILSITIEVK